MIRRFLRGAFLFLTLASAANAEADFLKEGARIVFLGDSITHDGHYITLLATQLGGSLELINLGLPSETCTGLSEPAHPFPRPDVHERLDRALEKSKPDVVVAGYGMNDAIYHPFDQERFEAYQKGMNLLVEKVQKAGAKCILLTPPAFDPLPMKKEGKLVPSGKDTYAWFAIYEGYDQVLKRYAEWILAQRDRVEMVIDLHTPVADYMKKKRKRDRGFVMSGDGIHINNEGHTVLAAAIAKAWGLPEVDLDQEVVEIVDEKQEMLHLAWLSHVGHMRPGVTEGLPLAEAQEKVAALASLRAIKSTSKLDALEAELREVEAQLASIAKDSKTNLDFPSAEKPKSLFNGKDLSGWEGDTRFWSVRNGVIRGGNTGDVPSSTYLFTKNAYRNFRLLFEVRQSVSPNHSTMHSAVAVLGRRFTDKGENAFGFKGPLLMFCHDWGIWDAYRRNRLEPANHRGTLNMASEKKGDWNQIEVLVTGNRIRFVANGELVFDFTDDPEMLQKSPIGLQLHSNKQRQTFRFRNLRIAEDPKDWLATLK